MKNMKKFASILLALVLAMALTVPALAAEGDTTGAESANDTTNMKGTITIGNAMVGANDSVSDSDIAYSAYQLFVLESYNNTAGTFAYKVTAAWKEFMTSGAGKAYVTVDANDYVTWNKDADVVAFAAAALAYAKSNNIVPTKTLTYAQVKAGTANDDGTYTVSMTELPLGYYLVDSALGTLCSLDTTNQNVEIKEKNDKPSIEKKVQEDANNTWGDSNTAQIGETVNFQSTVTVGKGVISYVLHDKMSSGLTFDTTSVKVDNVELSATVGTLKTTETTELTDDCTFEIEFADSFIKTKEGSNFIVTYSATLNANAAISPVPNTNDTKLTYQNGDGTTYETEEDHTDTYAFKFEMVKTTSDGTPLAGAEFQLYTKENASATDETLVKFTVTNGVYRVDPNGTVTTIVSTAGEVIVEGLDADGTQVYYLRETKAPDGYNKLTGDINIPFNGENIDAVDSYIHTNENGTLTVTKVEEGQPGDGKYIAPDGTNEGDSGVIIINKTGAEMPSTGGIGTTIFYTLGGLMVVAAGVLLVTKRRMHSNG